MTTLQEKVRWAKETRTTVEGAREEAERRAKEARSSWLEACRCGCGRRCNCRFVLPLPTSRSQPCSMLRPAWKVLPPWMALQLLEREEESSASILPQLQSGEEGCSRSDKRYQEARATHNRACATPSRYCGSPLLLKPKPGKGY